MSPPPQRSPLQENSLMALFLSQSISLSLSLSFFSSGSTNDEGDVRFSVITCGGACKSTGSHIILAGKYCETVLFIAIISAVVFEEIPVVLLNHIYISFCPPIRKTTIPLPWTCVLLLQPSFIANNATGSVEPLPCC